MVGVHSLLLNVRKVYISSQFYEFPNKCEDAIFRGERPSNFTPAGQFSNNGEASINNRPHGLYTTVYTVVDKYGASLQLMGHFTCFFVTGHPDSPRVTSWSDKFYPSAQYGLSGAAELHILSKLT